MKPIHVECKPDELLVSKLGFTRKLVTHHQGKSRIFHSLSKSKNILAMVDEDPESPKSSFEKKLKFIEDVEGIKYFHDQSENKVLVLKGTLEDWIIDASERSGIKLSTYGLPEEPYKLHSVITHKLPNFGNLIDDMLKAKNPALLKLKSMLV